MKINALGYSLKVWVTALVAGLLIRLFFIDLETGSGFSLPSLGDCDLLMWLGFLSSVAEAALFLLSTYIVSQISLSNTYKKSILTAIGLLLALLSFFTVDHFNSLTLSDVMAAAAYCVSTTGSVWIYKLKASKSSLLNDRVPADNLPYI